MGQQDLQLSATVEVKANYPDNIKSDINGKVQSKLRFNRCLQTPILLMVVIMYFQLELTRSVVHERIKEKRRGNLGIKLTDYLSCNSIQAACETATT